MLATCFLVRQSYGIVRSLHQELALTAPAPPNNSPSPTRARPGCATPTSSDGASATVRALPRGGQFWTPIGGHFSTPIDTPMRLQAQPSGLWRGRAPGGALYGSPRGTGGSAVVLGPARCLSGRMSSARRAIERPAAWLTGFPAGRPDPAAFPARHSCRQTALQALLARVCAQEAGKADDSIAGLR